MRAAVDEFAAHGFHDASLNRVIEAAGISKGSLYYYFDGKDDLYVHTVRTELEQLFARLDPLPLPTEGDPDAFWSTLEHYYLLVMSALVDSPQLAALIRGWIAASATPALRQAQQEVEQLLEPWLQQALVTGQRMGAIRTDLPPSLLIAVVSGMGQAMDIWLLVSEPDRSDLPRLIGTLIEMIRGAVRPVPAT
ncbi:MAG: TetR/AcrR family transcriptional regulator [Microlunatus sp.]